MFSIGVTNLRRLSHIDPIALKPITLLVGRNSSGKSTFLRTIPLIKQSVSTRTSSPILWWGDYVDFGDFERTVTDHDTNKQIGFSFNIDRIPLHVGDFSYDETDEIGDDIGQSLGFEIQLHKDKRDVVIKDVKVRDDLNKCQYSISLGNRGKVTALSIDEFPMLDKFEDFQFICPNTSFFPELVVFKNQSIEQDNSNFRFYSDRWFVKNSLKNLLGDFLDSRIVNNSFDRVVSLLLTINHVTQNSLLELSEQKSIRPNLSRFLRELGTRDRHNLFPSLRRLLLVSRVPHLLRASRANMRRTFLSSLYIGPTRAKSDRYYRYQDLSVADISPDGNNFPMFLNSLRPRDLTAFSDWVREIYGYGVQVTRTSGHISIELGYPTGLVNIVDTGFGVSQVLPVLGQLWWSARRRIASPPRTHVTQLVAIEQPELHLHPAHQALLADAFATISKSENRDGKQQFQLIETHSESLINRFGQLIRERRLKAEDIAIIVFGQDQDVLSAENSLEDAVQLSSFDSEGRLQNWPYGFFLADQ